MPIVYDIFIEENNVVKKQIKDNDSNEIVKGLREKLLIKAEQDKFMNIVTNAHKLDILGNFVIGCIKVEKDGTYYTNLVDGYNLNDLLPTDHIDYTDNSFIHKNINELTKEQCLCILKKLVELEFALYRFSKTNQLIGDWMPHNLVYDTTNQKIVNVDLEGFYTYTKPHMKQCNANFLFDIYCLIKDTLVSKLNANIFSVILWGPVEKYFDEIENEISNKFPIINVTNLKIKNIQEFITNIYEFDTRCNKYYLSNKIQHIEKFGTKIRFFLILMYPNYNKSKISRSALNFKASIRKKYFNYIKNICRQKMVDITIHIADNDIESKGVFKCILNQV